MAIRKRDIGLGVAIGAVLAGHVVVATAGAAVAVRWFGGIAAVSAVVLLVVLHIVGLRRLAARRRTAAAGQQRIPLAERGPTKADE